MIEYTSGGVKDWGEADTKGSGMPSYRERRRQATAMAKELEVKAVLTARAYRPRCKICNSFVSKAVSKLQPNNFKPKLCRYCWETQ